MMRMVNQRIMVVIVALMAALTLCVQAQRGPQQHWVREPDLEWSVPANPTDICVDSNRVYVQYGGTLYHYTLDGMSVTNWSNAGSYIDSDDAYIYMAYGGENRIKVFTKDNEFVREWEGYGKLAVDHDRVYVLAGNVVKVYSKAGDYLFEWGGVW